MIIIKFLNTYKLITHIHSKAGQVKLNSDLKILFFMIQSSLVSSAMASIILKIIAISSPLPLTISTPLT